MTASDATERREMMIEWLKELGELENKLIMANSENGLLTVERNRLIKRVEELEEDREQLGEITLRAGEDSDRRRTALEKIGRKCFEAEQSSLAMVIMAIVEDAITVLMEEL